MPEKAPTPNETFAQLLGDVAKGAGQGSLADSEKIEKVSKGLDDGQRRKLRLYIVLGVSTLLFGQIVILAVFLLLQGFGWGGFKLEQWTFGIWVNGTVIQTYLVLKIIVQHLFPLQQTRAKLGAK